MYHLMCVHVYHLMCVCVCVAVSVLLTWVRGGALGADSGAHAVHAYPVPLPGPLSSLQQVQLALQVTLLSLQRLQLVLALTVCLFKFLIGQGERESERGGVLLCRS